MEDAWRQLRLLLWKNCLLRIRQPVILTLELLWPIIIFVAIMGARWTIPPVDRPTCHYNAWALPSTGAVPFLQTLICNIDNDCLNETGFHDVPSYPNSRIEELVEHVVPLLSDEKLRQFVEILPKGTKLAQTLLDILSQHDLRLIITSGLPVSSLLKRSNETKMFLNKYFTPTLTEELLASYIRLPQLLNFMSSTSSFCLPDDPEFTFSSVWPQVMQQFCSLNESRQKEFTEYIQEHLDVSNIVLMIGNVMSQLGRVDVGETLSRIGSILQNLSAKYLFPSLFNGDIRPLLDDVANLLAKIQAGDLNFDLLSLIANDAAPLYEGSNWSIIKALVDQLKKPSDNKTDTQLFPGSNAASLNPDESSMLQNRNIITENIGASLFKSRNQNSSSQLSPKLNFVQTFGDWVEIVMHILRLLPKEQFAEVTGHRLFGMFRFFVVTVYKIVKTSSKGDFQDFIDLVETLFFTISDTEKGFRSFEPSFWTKSLCNKTEFLMYLNIPNGIYPATLQEFACNMSTTIVEIIDMWPLNRDVKSPSPKEESSSIVKMLDYLVSYRPKELAHGPNSGIFKAKLLRLQLTFSNFVQRLRDKANLTDSVVTLLRVTHSAFPESSWSNVFVPTFLNFIQRLADYVNPSKLSDPTALEKESMFPPLVLFIRGLINSVAETSETAIWESLDLSMIRKMIPGKISYCENNTEHIAVQFLCNQNSSLSDLQFPGAKRIEKQLRNSNLNWNQMLSNLRSIETNLKAAFPQKLKNFISPALFPSILSAINAGTASLHIFLPIHECPIIFKIHRSLESMLCNILRFQKVQISLNETTPMLQSAIQSMTQDKSLFMWKTFSMLAQQMLDFVDDSADSKEEIISTIDKLINSAQNASKEIDWQNHVQLLFSVVHLVGSRLEKDVSGVRFFFHTVQPLINLVVNRLQHIDSSSSEDSNVIRVEDVFPDAPVTQALVKSLFPRLPEVLSTLFWTSLAQGKLHHLAVESQKNLTVVTSLLCNETITDYLYNPSFEGKSQWDSLMAEICSHQYFKVFEEMLDDPDIQTIIFERDNIDEPIEWDEIKQGVMDLTSLTIKLSQERKVDTSVFPAPDLWNELWLNTSNTAQKPSVVIYVLSNSVFYPFCNKEALENRKITLFKSDISLPKPLSVTNITELSTALCYMSTEEFANNFARTWSKPLSLDNSVFENGTWRQLYDSLLNSTNIRAISRPLLGSEGFQLFEKLDSLVLSEWDFSNITSFSCGFLNASKIIYKLTDLITDGNETEKLAYSFLPYFLEKFNSILKPGQPMYVEDVIQNSTLWKLLVSEMAESFNELRIFNKWLSMQVNFFNNADHLKILTSSCLVNDSVTFNDTDHKHEIKNIICGNKPTKWTMLSQQLYEKNSDTVFEDYKKLISLLSASLNDDRIVFTKKEMSTWVKTVLQMMFSNFDKLKVRHEEWKVLETPRFYFSFFRALLWAVQTLHERNSAGLNESCAPSDWSLMWSQIPNRLMNSIPDAEYMFCKLPLNNISSVYKNVSEILNIKSLLMEYFKVTSSIWSIDCPNSQPVWFNLTMSWLLSGVDLAERIFKQDTPESSYWKNVKLCTENITSSILFADISSLGNLTKHVTRIISSLSGAGPNRRNWNNIEGEINTFIAQQLPGFSTLSSFLNMTLQLDPSSSRNASFDYVLKVLEKSAFNLNWLSQQNFSTDALKASFCQKKNNVSDKAVPFEDILRLPPHQEAIEEVLQFLCYKDGFEFLFSRINMDIVNKTLREAQEREFRTGRWFRDLFATSSGIMDDLARLVQASQQICITPPKSSKELIEAFVKISRTSAIHDVMEGLNGIIGKLKSVFKGSLLLHYLQEILDGAQAFQNVQKLKLFKFSLTVSQLFPDDEMKKSSQDYLHENYAMSAREIEDFFHNELDISKVVQLQENGCAKDSDFNSTDAIAPKKNFSYILCDLIEQFGLKITPNDLRDLVLGKLLKNAGELSLQGILSKAGMSLPEVQQIMELLSNATDMIPNLEFRLQKLISVLEPNMKEQLSTLKIAEDGIASLASPEALSASGSILCGKPLKTLNRKFSLLNLGDNTEPTVDNTEVQSLPNEFCQNAYKQMLKLPGGPILWGFLKPVFRGQILYSPKHTPTADAVIRALNTTLSGVTKYIQLFQAVAVGTTGLHYLEHKKDLVQSIQVLLGSKQVSRIMGLDGNLISGVLGAGDWGKSWSGDERFGSKILEVMTLVGNVSQCITLNRFVGFDSEAELEKAAMMLHTQREFIAAIVFLPNKDAYKAKYLPHNISYKIRMDIDNVPTAKEIKRRWWHPYPFDNFFDDFRYFRGFIQLQELIDSAIIKLHTSKTMQNLPYKKYMQQFPYPCHQEDQFGGVVIGSLSGVMTVSWIFLIAFLVRDKVLERELSLQDILDVMGLNPAVAWLSWFLTGFATISVSVCGSVIIMKWGGITPLSDPIILFIFIFQYAVLVISFCYLMSVLFKKASTAALMAVLLYFLSFFPFVLYVTWEVYFLFWQKLIMCLLIATCFCFGTLYLTRLEEQGTGLQWDNLWISPIPDDSMNMAMALIGMALCTCFYFGLASYISRFKNRRHTTAKIPWYLKALPPHFTQKTTVLNAHKDDSSEFEDAPKEKIKNPKAESVSIRGLHVIYHGRTSNEGKEAVCGLNLGLHESQITTLLGHNGAGKTTTIKVLTGRLHPNSGDINIYGYNIPDGLSEARKLIGYCPQYNTLFSKLTVREHLYLFAQLKGVLFGPQLDADVDDMIKSLGLEKKQHEWTENLSGGQQRRLCVGMAFVGGSKFIVLDEPTSSVDPLARRSIWDLIEQYKTGRTILLTTHHLDEADILSDDIVVLHKGKVLCAGSPLFLKSRFGSGYKLSILAANSSLEDPDEDDSGNASSLGSSIDFKGKNDEIQMDGNGLMQFIQRYIPCASLLENGESHLVVSLPQISNSQKEANCLSQFFQELDKKLSSFGFKSYTLTSTSLEEVFITLCRVEDAKRQFYKPEVEKSYLPIDVYKSLQWKDNYYQNREANYLHNDTRQKYHYKTSSSSSMEDVYNSNHQSNTSIRMLTGYHLVYSQFTGLLKKRLWHTRRNWKIVICSIAMPCFFIALAMGLSVSRPARRAEPQLLLSPNLYKAQKTGYTTSFISSEQWSTPMSTPLLHSLIETDGSGGTCRDFEPGEKCSIDLSFDNSKKWCLCKEKEQCFDPDPTVLPVIVRSGNEVFYNLSGHNLPRHLLSNYIKFNEKRYGGWTVTRNDVSSDEKSSNIKVWFDNSGYHAAPSYLNALHNAMLRSSVHFFNQTEYNYGITTYSHPMQISAEQLSQETLLQRLGEIGIAYVFLVGLSLIPAASSVYLVREASLEEKRVQIAAGINPILYWMTHLAWDLISLLLTTGLASLVIHGFNLTAFVYRYNFAAVVSLILSFGWCSLTMMYMATRLFKEGSLAFMVLFTTNIFLGLVVMMIILSLHMLNISSDAEQALNIVKRLALVFPQWSLLGGLTSLAQNQLQSDIYHIFGQDTYGNPFSWRLLLPNYVFLLVEGILFFCINIAIEVGIISSIRKFFRFGRSNPVALKTRRLSRLRQDGLIKLQNVSKVYRNRLGENYAVNDVTLGISRGECFGLVGANGAGKTTLFRMLSGQSNPTQGNIVIGDNKNNKRKSGFLGYCPQADALDDLLTPKEHLILYALMKGIHPGSIEQVIEDALNSFDLIGHLDCPVKALSGGTKRKLCTAIAMIGSPLVILLDEPTSGMDPATRRLVWTSIMNVTTKKQKAAVILSSHSIEECDILCSRIGIMVNGQIQCLGTPQELKSIYGDNLQISFRAPNVENANNEYSRIQNYIKTTFPTAQLKGQHCTTVEFSVCKTDLPLWRTVELLEDGMHSLGLQDIAINHTTLDQVFVGFVQQQSDGIQENPINIQIGDGSEQELAFSVKSFTNSGFSSDQDISWTENSHLECCTRL